MQNSTLCKIYEVKCYESTSAYIHDEFIIQKNLYIPKYKLCVNYHHNNIWINDCDETNLNSKYYNFIKNIIINDNIIDNILTIYNNRKNDKNKENVIKEFLHNNL